MHLFFYKQIEVFTAYSLVGWSTSPYNRLSHSESFKNTKQETSREVPAQKKLFACWKSPLAVMLSQSCVHPSVVLPFSLRVILVKASDWRKIKIHAMFPFNNQWSSQPDSFTVTSRVNKVYNNVLDEITSIF